MGLNNLQFAKERRMKLKDDTHQISKSIDLTNNASTP